MRAPAPVQVPSGIAEGREGGSTVSGFPVEGLMDFMAESITVFNTLRRVLAEEKAGILRSDASQVEQCNQMKEDLLPKIRSLDEWRSTLWRDIGACIGRDPASLTLSDLLEVEPMACLPEFRASLSTLTGLLSEVRKTSSHIQDLVQGALKLIKGSISLLTGLLNGQGIYQKSGAIGMGNQAGKLLSKAL